LPQVEGEALPKRKFEAYSIGYFNIHTAEVRPSQGDLYPIVAIDRTPKFAFVELHEKVARRTAADFVRRLIEAVPHKVHTVLTTTEPTLPTLPARPSSAPPKKGDGPAVMSMTLATCDCRRRPDAAAPRVRCLYDRARQPNFIIDENRHSIAFANRIEPERRSLWTQHSW